MNSVNGRIEIMNSDKKKDALTDLVDGAGSDSATDTNSTLQEGEARTPSGEIVTLGADDKELTNLARRLLKWAKTKAGAEHIKKSLEDK